MHIEENVSVKPLTTFGVGGTTRYLASPQNKQEVIEAIAFAHNRNVPFFVLGGGSNIVFSDADYPGLIIRPAFFECAINGTHVTVGASYDLQKLITKTLDAGLTGMEFAAGIPGTVGGAVRGNAGTYGVDMSSIVERVHGIDPHRAAPVTLTKDQCDFRYRHSIFKTNELIITDLDIALSQGTVEESRRVIEERIHIRRTNHPLEPSAGCIFKNIEFDKVDIAQLKKYDLDIDRFSTYKKIPAGYLIESLDLKGKMIGGAQISPKHANYIINNGTATATDVITLISLIKQQVRDTYGVQLEEEVHIFTSL